MGFGAKKLQRWRGLFHFKHINSQKPLTNVPLLNISHPKELTLYLYTPFIQKNKRVWWPKRKPVYQNHCCFIISDIMLTFQWSYNLIGLSTLRQHCLPFVKTLIYTLPSVMGLWSMTGTHRHCSNTATQRWHFLFSLCLCFMHKYTWIYVTQVYTYFQWINKKPLHEHEDNTPISSPNVISLFIKACTPWKLLLDWKENVKDQNQNWTKTSLVHSKHCPVAKEQQKYLKYSSPSPAYKEKDRVC